MLKGVLIVLWILLLISGGMMTYYYLNLKAEEKQLIIQTNEAESANIKSKLSMFMNDMRFDTSNISYTFIDCKEDAKERMRNAFQIVTNETGILHFYENGEPKIVIYCSDQLGEERNNTFVAGEGGPNKVILSDLYPLIVDGKVYLNKQEERDRCEYPVVEIHELMHVFGFDHISNKSKILYPYVSCSQRITPDITSELIRIYSEKAKADLTLKNLSAKTHGTYLDFEITIQNRGLIEGKNISLAISGNKNLIEAVQIENLEPGISQTIKAKNVFTKSLDIKQVTFKVTTDTEEYFYENNQLTAVTTP